jgi:SM-20-related protein
MATVPHFIADNFLPDAVHQGLLQHVLNVEDFASGKVIANGKNDYQPEVRKGQLSNDNLGPYLHVFRSALHAAFVDIRIATGVAQFDLAEIEIRLAAHSDGDFFSAHRDSFTGVDRMHTRSDRLITSVYYLHQLPRRFQGGELHIHPFDRSAPAVVEPCDNRLVAFPSFMLHEVLPVSVPSGKFADSRFSVSCWFDRERPAVAIS